MGVLVGTTSNRSESEGGLERWRTVSVGEAASLMVPGYVNGDIELGERVAIDVYQN